MHHAHSWHSAKYIHPWLEIYSPLTWNIFALTKHSAANVPCIIHHPMTWGLSQYQVFPSLDKNLTAVNGKKVARSFRTNKSRLSARKTVFWGGGDLPGGGGAREPARKEGRKGGGGRLTEGASCSAAAAVAAATILLLRGLPQISYGLSGSADQISSPVKLWSFHILTI